MISSVTSLILLSLTSIIIVSCVDMIWKSNGIDPGEYLRAFIQHPLA